MKTFSKTPGNDQKQLIKCQLCQSSHETHYKLFDYLDYSFKRCRNCGLVFQNPQPVFSDIAERYDSDYFSYEIDNEESFFNLMRLGLEDIGFRDLKLPSRHNNTFLDAGCATGRLLEYMKSLGWKTAGVELCTEAAEYGNSCRNVNIFNGTLEKADFKPSSFTVVHASHLIEHLNNPDSFFKESSRILIPGGFLILVTPNIDGFQARFFKSRWRSAIPDHLYLFSIKTLSAMAVKNGFNPVKTATWGGLARGLAPLFIKKIFDYSAKKFGFGDVMILLLKKQ